MTYSIFSSDTSTCLAGILMEAIFLASYLCLSISLSFPRPVSIAPLMIFANEPLQITATPPESATTSYVLDFWPSHILHKAGFGETWKLYVSLHWRCIFIYFSQYTACLTSYTFDMQCLLVSASTVCAMCSTDQLPPHSLGARHSFWWMYIWPY